MSYSYIVTDTYISVMDLTTGAVNIILRESNAWDKAVDLIRNHDYETFMNLSPKVAVDNFINNMNNSIYVSQDIKLRINDNVVEVCYDGSLGQNSSWKVLENAFCDRIIKMGKMGISPDPMMKFMTKLLNNPSKTIVNELPLFLENNELPITENGDFIAYKMVRDDYTSIHDGKFMNKVGTIVSMPRNEVDDKRDNVCSTGLHFCNRNYLNSYGSSSRDTDRLLLLVIDPKDVVSIPSDYNNAKGRASKYYIWKDVTEAEWRKVYKNKDFTDQPVVNVAPKKVTKILDRRTIMGPYKFGYASGVHDCTYGYGYNESVIFHAMNDFPSNPNIARCQEGYSDGWDAVKNGDFIKYSFSE